MTTSGHNLIRNNSTMIPEIEVNDKGNPGAEEKKNMNAGTTR
jgi:hypothetical protein